MVIDTSIVIQHIRTKDKSNTTFYRLLSLDKISLSSVSLYELYIGATTIGKENNIQLLIQNIEVLPFTELIAIKASQIFHQLKAKNQLIEFRDIFTAATCITANLPIKTLNKKHFERIQGLEIA